MKLQRLTESVYYLPWVVNSGVIVGQGDQAVVVDTGIGDRSGRRIMAALEAEGLRPVAVLNTHCHGDHVGGNAWLVEQAGVKVYAPLYDSVVIRFPVWGRLCIFAGGEPIRELAVPRFAFRPTEVDVLVSEGELEIAGITIQAVALPGHTGTHTGYVADEVFFLGDLLAGEEELERAKISYVYSVTKRLESLEKLKGYRCAWYVPGHGPALQDIGELIERNIARTEETLAFIVEYLRQNPAEAAEVLAAVCEHFGIAMHNAPDYFLLHPTIYSHLSHLHSQGIVQFSIEGNRLLWSAE